MFLFCFGISVSLQCVFLVKDRSQKFYSLILSIIIKLCLSEICDSLYRHAFSLFFNFSRRFKKIIFKRYVGIMPIQFFLVECQLNSKGKKEKESVLYKKFNILVELILHYFQFSARFSPANCR